MRRIESKHRRYAAAISGVLLALGMLGACNGDTLYETPPANLSPPTLQVQLAPLGTDLLAGRPARVHVEATDSVGVSQIEIAYRGVTTGTIRVPYSPPVGRAVLDTAIATPEGVSGNLEITVRAVNAYQAASSTAPASIIVAAQDRFAPTVSLESVTLPPRMEIDDSLSVSIVASDNPGGVGLVRVGLSIIVTSSARADTLVLERTIDTAAPAEGTVRGTFALLPPFATLQAIPESMTLQFHAWAVDAAGNCAAAIDATPQQLACRQRGTNTVADGRGQVRATLVVAGRSVPLPAGADIADAVADVNRERLYLSNRASGRIEVLDLPQRRFSASVRVGSEPWGIALNRGKDTLIVANSGGTSISFVSLSGTPAEDAPRRFHTLNTPLFEFNTVFEPSLDSLGARLIDFNDRPQFVAQDAAGRLLFSTTATASRAAGTLRIAVMEAGWQRPEVRVLRGPGAVNPMPDTGSISALVVANVDSIRRDGRTGNVVIFDHVSGFPTQVISTPLLRPDSAVRAMAATAGSDIYWRWGLWNLNDLQFRDTTFVSAAADHNRIVFGEGNHPTGRILLWKSDSSDVSNEITVADLVGNGSEQILDVQLNADGTLGLARGLLGAYAFKRDLRLQGFARPVSAAARRSGAVLHPQHPSTPTYSALPPSGPTTVAFTDDGSAIRIFDTVHFVDRGSIPVRDDIVGPLRVSPPLPGDNASCSGADCIVAKLYGVTSVGAVVVVDVRGRDIK